MDVAGRAQAIRVTDARVLLVGAAGVTAAIATGVLVRPEVYLGAVALMVLALGGFVAVAMQVDRPAFGLTVLVVTSVLLPIEFRGPSAGMVSTSLPIAAGLCAIWLLRLFALGGNVRFVRSRLVLALVAFMAIAVAAFINGLVPIFPSGGAPLPAQAAQLVIFLVSGCLCLVVAHQLATPAQVSWIAWVFVGAGTLASMTFVVPSLGALGDRTVHSQSVGSLFWTWLVAISASQALFNRQLRPLARLALFAVTLLVLGHGLLQVRSWASGWLPPLVVLGMLVLLRLPRLTIGTAMLGLPVALMAWGYVSNALMEKETYSLLTRQEAWRVLWNLVERSPLLGTGPANYYYYTENYSIMGWYVRFISHNNYQDFLVQTGFLGLLAFCWFGVEAAWLAFRMYRRTAPGFDKAYAAGALAGVAGSLASGMLGDWIVPFYYNAGILGFRSSLLFWVFVGGLLALERVQGAQAADANSAPAAHWPRLSEAVR
jgi:hypothetical protein